MKHSEPVFCFLVCSFIEGPILYFTSVYADDFPQWVCSYILISDENKVLLHLIYLQSIDLLIYKIKSFEVFSN